jgi:hypothetical protein
VFQKIRRIGSEDKPKSRADRDFKMAEPRHLQEPRNQVDLMNKPRILHITQFSTLNTKIRDSKYVINFFIIYLFLVNLTTLFQ